MKQISEVESFLKDVGLLTRVPVTAKYKKLLLEEYPFDHQLLSLSKLYRKSRETYLALPGAYSRKVSSTMRSLSTHDLFENDIQYSPIATEIAWFMKNTEDVSDPAAEVQALLRFGEISIFHEQNHRICWRLLPPVPKSQAEVSRYLNFSESLVATLDVAMADEIGGKLSPAFERLKVTYRVGGLDKWAKSDRKTYREYLLAFFCATYFSLEIMHPDDVPGAVDYVLPGQKRMNRDAVRRGQELSELFTRVTNPLWQERHWKLARQKLGRIHRESVRAPLRLPKDPLAIDTELDIVLDALAFYGI